MQLKMVSTGSFFKPASPALMKVCYHAQPLLEGFFSETTEGRFERKVALTEQYLVISQRRGEEFEVVLFLEVTDDLKFQRAQLSREVKSKTPLAYGFSLINQKQQAVGIYFQFPSILQLWVNRLSNTLNEVGFHQQYRILAKIGKGSSSTVYKVQRIADQRIFAAKVFLKSYLESKAERKGSVSNEISLLRVMEHSNILKIHGVYESNSAIYVITEHLEGGTLIERINENKGFRVNEVKKIMTGVVAGLNYMHRYGVMHRDIKLENIMFRSKDSLEVVLVDFGLAAISEDQPYTFYRCGTPGYIAPEIITMEQNQRIDVSCDVFSAGVILHILLTNKYLFEGQNNQQIYKNNKNLHFDLSQRSYSHYDQAGIDLLKEMLELDSFQRISTEQVLQHPFFQGILPQQSSRQKQEISPAVTISGEQSYNL